jgi:mannose-6-phosphate isomerase-like protein (cupin superfamily)
MATYSSYRGSLFDQAGTNEDFRRVLSTTAHTQLVVMTIPPGGVIGAEIHDDVDQVLIALEGSGTSILDGQEVPFSVGDVVVVPQGTRHNFINVGEAPLRIATVYGPPDHRPGTIHHTKRDAEADKGDLPPPR